MVGLYHDWVSSALVINRRVYRGDHGLASGIGHLTVDYGPRDVAPRPDRDRPGFYDMCSCGRGFGHLEALATPARIAGQTGLPFEQAAREPYDQRSPVTAAFATAGEALGRGISTMLDIANPGQLLLLLPESLARAVEGTAAVAYKRALLTAVHRYSYSTAAGDPAHPATLIIDEVAPDDADADAAQAAAVCVLDRFIAYARGE
jgi:predicted NBD/HSP70 family sugar kinase